MIYIYYCVRIQIYYLVRPDDLDGLLYICIYKCIVMQERECLGRAAAVILYYYLLLLLPYNSVGIVSAAYSAALSRGPKTVSGRADQPRSVSVHA